MKNTAANACLFAQILCESFESIKDFHQRMANYQAWYNLVGVNNNKEYKAPWQIIKEARPKMDRALVRLPPVMFRLAWT